jgi:hypothetical protein
VDSLDPPKAVPGDELDRLFHGALEEFTPSRNGLAKSLRADGEREAADWVKGLHKPTRAAWLVNQLSARKPKEVAELLKAGARLRRAQEQLLAGSADREQLRELAAGEQRAIDALMRTATAIGREHRVGSQALDRVAETLQAASSDPEVAVAIESGRLEREQRAVSLGLTGAAGPAPPKQKASEDDAAERRARQEAARARKAAERKLATARKRVARERAAVKQAAEALSEREQRLREAERDEAAAAAELDSS